MDRLPQGGSHFRQNLTHQPRHKFLRHGGGEGTLGHEGGLLAVQQGGEAVGGVFVKARHECGGQLLRRVGHVLRHTAALGGQLQRGKRTARGGAWVRRIGCGVICTLPRIFLH